MADRVGPLYCETGHPWLFMAEPVNTLTNAAILMAAIFGLRALLRTPRPWPADALVLVILLFATAFGSFLWHAFRTRLGLTLDVVPGLLFLFVFVFGWMRRLGGSLAASGGLLAVIASTVGTMAFIRGHLPDGETPAHNPLLFAPIYGILLGAGLLLVYVTRRTHGSATGWPALGVLEAAAAAAFFRSIDLSTCAVIPIGTHFLWHVFLSLAAYRAIVLVLRLTPAPGTARRFGPAADRQ